MIDTHVKGAFLATQAVLRAMVRERYGRIVNVGSLAGVKMMQAPVHYATAKAALKGFTESLAKEIGRYGITVNCVAPGILDEGVSDHLPPGAPRGVPAPLRAASRRAARGGRDDDRVRRLRARQLHERRDDRRRRRGVSHSAWFRCLRRTACTTLVHAERRDPARGARGARHRERRVLRARALRPPGDRSRAPPHRRRWARHLSERALRRDAARVSPMRSMECVLECAGNSRTRMHPTPPGVPWGDGAVGNAVWEGPRLADVLRPCHPREGAVEVVFTGADRGVEDGIRCRSSARCPSRSRSPTDRSSRSR